MKICLKLDSLPLFFLDCLSNKYGTKFDKSLEKKFFSPLSILPIRFPKKEM